MTTPTYCLVAPRDFFTVVTTEWPDRRPSREQRKHPRKIWYTQASIQIEHETRIIGVTTVDISAKGCGLLVRPYLHVGTRIVLFLHAVEGCPAVKCAVRSCELVEDMDHRAGVEFDVARKKLPV